MDELYLKILETRSDPLGVRASTLPIFKNLTFIKLDKKKLSRLVEIVENERKKNNILTAQSLGVHTLSPQRVFVMDAINFCFWSRKGEERWSVEYPEGNVIKGGWYAFTACFDRALEEGIPILDAKYLSEVTVDDVRYIFRSATSGKIPLLAERVEILNAVGRVLRREFGGKIDVLLEKSKYDAVEIAKNVISYFPSFEDFSEVDGEKVFFYKRAQIFAYDLSLLPGLTIGSLDDLTVFADYKLPQMMRYFGVLEYERELAERVEAQELLEKGSREEVEIRAATVWVGELLAYKLGVAPVLVDNILWLLSQDQPEDIQPYHRVLTTSY